MAKRSHRIRVRKSRDHRCYELSVRGILNDGSWKLVHGTTKGRMRDGNVGRIGHAWLERDDVCYDAVDDAEFDRVTYYATNEAVAEAVYTRVQALEKAVLTGRCGPWHEH
jgi:hypothetical protein